MSNSGIITTLSRKWVDVCDLNFEIHKGKLATKVLGATIGDQVEFITKPSEILVNKILPRKNLLTRSYFNQEKPIAANLDHIYIVMAAANLFSVDFIDRVLCAARLSQIPTSLVINKIDLGIEHLEAAIKIYTNLNIEIIKISARDGLNFDQFENDLKKHQLACLVGPSGAGKSSILKRLLPENEIKINQVSQKDSRGTNTTNQSQAYLIQKSPTIYLIDLPGIQSFGLAHIPLTELTKGFIEFNQLPPCKYPSCLHQSEPGCQVKAALHASKISSSRFQSYWNFLAEERKVAY